MRKKGETLLFAIFVTFFCVCLLLNKKIGDEKKYNFNTFEEIQQEKILRVGILHNYSDYYLNNGKIEGFQYEMTEKLAEKYNLNVHYLVAENQNDLYILLLNNEVDMLAIDVCNTPLMSLFFSLTKSHSYSDIVVVQNKKHKVVTFKNNNLLVLDTQCRFFYPLIATDNFNFNFNQYLSDTSIKYCFHNTKSIVDMLQYIDTSRTNFSFALSKTFTAYAPLFQHLDANIRLGEKISQHWIVAKRNISLKNNIDLWLEEYMKTIEYRLLLKKYNQQKKSKQQIHLTKEFRKGNRISKKDDIFKKYGKKYHIDWRFLAAVAYHESRFDANAIGLGQTIGIMQMKPSTASDLGNYDLSNEEHQIQAGAHLIAELLKRFEKINVYPQDKYAFVLAAYNAGFGKIEEAMLLTKKMGRDPYSWNDVKSMLLLMKNKSFVKKYNLTRVYKRGKITIDYVQEIFKIYEHYCNLVEL